MVPPSGVEPELPKEPDFESGASTNSAKGADRQVARTSIGGASIRQGGAVGGVQAIFGVCRYLNSAKSAPMRRNRNRNAKL